MFDFWIAFSFSDNNVEVNANLSCSTWNQRMTIIRQFDMCEPHEISFFPVFIENIESQSNDVSPIVRSSPGKLDET